MFFVKSIKYPETFDLVSGKTQLDDYIISINRCLGLLLTTAKGELLGDPDFGCDLYEILFDQYSNTLEALIKKDIIENVTKFEKRISISESDIEITENDTKGRNSYNIAITYTVVNSSSKYTTNILLEERDTNG